MPALAVPAAPDTSSPEFDIRRSREPESYKLKPYGFVVLARASAGGFLDSPLMEHAHVDDFDRITGERMAVFPLVRLVEALPNLLELALADDADRKRDFQLVALADVAQIAVADERHAGRFQMIGDELPAQLILHGGDVGIEPIEIDIAADLELGADGIVFQIRGQKPHGRGNARIGRHDHLPKAEHGGHFDAVQRARAAERDQCDQQQISADRIAGGRRSPLR